MEFDGPKLIGDLRRDLGLAHFGRRQRLAEQLQENVDSIDPARA